MKPLLHLFVLMFAAGGFSTAHAQTSPVDVFLTSFTAAQNGNTVCLHWTTASESNCDFFTVEKTKDGVNYETVGTVTASGASSQPLAYALDDSNPENGVSYYRLKGTGHDGMSVDFTPVAVTVDIERRGLSVYPNPATADVVHVMCPPGPARLEIRSTRGRLLMQQDVNSADGQEYAVEVGHLREGGNSTMIFISVYGADFSDTKILVLQ